MEPIPNVNTLMWIVSFLLCSVNFGTVVAFNVDMSPLIFSGPPNSYFGYSVSILKNSQGTWLLVGAPRANDSSLSGVREPGAVFQCNWQYRSSCQPIFIDHIGNEKQVIPKSWRNITLMHHKDGQWLGASIDVNVHGNSAVTICAPRWVGRRFSVQGMHFMNGLCYESNKELIFNESSAIPALEYYKKQIHKNGYHSYGSGSLGMSAAYSQNGKFSVLGTPGLNDWSGGFAFVDGTKDVKPRIMEIPVEIHNNSYFGMSITTARLAVEDVSIIMGGPKSGPEGKIMAYNKKFQLLFVKDGEQLGSSFGWSVCAVDLNNDGLDDLVVGAPMYSDVSDEGRVYVYINKEFFNMELIKPILAGSNVKGARFGMAVGNVGDLNGDGYEDIAVGAPYEEQSGVVYIYNGAKSGMHFDWSQRIVGKSFNRGLKTFGWSFSRPWDVDSNHYKDFAVGAFESNNVVLLRTRSVLDLSGSLEVTPSLLNIKGATTCNYKGKPWPCLKAKICLRYKGLNLPPSTEVNITLKLDTLERHRGERSRLFTQDDNGKEVESLNKLVTVRLGRRSCYQRYKIYVRASRDVLTPLKLELEYKIASDSIGITSLCTICPIRNIYNPSSVHDLVDFVSDCGDDNECDTDLSLQTRAVFNNKQNAFVIDDHPSYEMEITVSNQEETSYFTVVTLEYPKFVYYASVKLANDVMNDIICMQSTTKMRNNSSVSSITCEIIVPLRKDEQAVFTVKFYAHDIPYAVHEFDVLVNASSASKEREELTTDNSVTVTIPIFMESNVELTGVSIPAQVAVAPKSEDKLPSLSLSHFYTLRNFGPSPIPHAHLTLSVPQFYGLDVKDVHVETAAVKESSHVPVECSFSEKVATSMKDNMFLGRKKYDDESGSFMTCTSSPCAHIRCYIGLMHQYEAVYLNISMSIKQDVLDSLEVTNQLGFVSTGWLEEPDYSTYYSVHITQNTTIGSLIVYAWHSQTSVQWWILALSVICGLLVLYIITVILWKCGFFRRKRREELQNLMKATEAEREILNADSLSATSSDIMVLPPNDNSIMFTSPMSHNNNNDSHRSAGHFNEGHNVSSLYRRNYNYDDESQELFIPVGNGHSSYTHPRQIRHPLPEQEIARPQRLDTFNSMPRSESRYNSQYYLQPLSDYDYQQHQNSRNAASNNVNTHSRRTLNDRLEYLRIPPSHSTVSSQQAFNNDMYLEPLESRG